MSKKEEKKPILSLSPSIIEALAKFQQIELEDVEIYFDERSTHHPYTYETNVDS